MAAPILQEAWEPNRELPEHDPSRAPRQQDPDEADARAVYRTVNVTVVECTRLPLVPLMVIV